jgi:transposase
MPAGSRRQAEDQLVLHLAGGLTKEQAAQLAGISRATAFRWLADPAFRRRVAEARAEMVERAAGSLSAGAVEASVVLRQLLQSKNEKVRLAAAKVVLETGTKIRQAAELEARVLALEARSRSRKAGR